MVLLWSFQFPTDVSLQWTCSTKISNALGVGSPQAARLTFYAAMSLATTEALAMSLVIFSCRYVYGYIYSNHIQVVNYVAKIGISVCCNGHITWHPFRLAHSFQINAKWLYNENWALPLKLILDQIRSICESWGLLPPWNSHCCCIGILGTFEGKRPLGWNIDRFLFQASSPAIKTGFTD